MRTILVFFALSFILELNAQNTTNAKAEQQKLFVRLYNNSGEKIGKGNLLEGPDSLIGIKHQHKHISYPVSEISFIKTRHSTGHTILVGTAVRTATGIILITAGATTDNPDPNITSGSSFDLALAGAVTPFVGAITGSLAAVLRKRETIQVYGDREKWISAKEQLFKIKSR